MVTIMASYQSFGSSMPSLVEYDVKEEVKKIRGTVEVIDFEQGNVEGDIVFLRKEFKCTVRKTKSAIIKILANLEVKVDKLELRVVRLECANNSGSLSRLYGDSK